MNYIVTLCDIIWDTEVDGRIEEVDLPTKYEVEIIEVDTWQDAVDEAIDRVTDLFGYCIHKVGIIRCDEGITT